jgi:hypothetical protein
MYQRVMQNADSCFTVLPAMNILGGFAGTVKTLTVPAAFFLRNLHYSVYPIKPGFPGLTHQHL